MMKDYYQQSMRALQLAGLSKRTQECYTRSVRMLADFYNKTPDQITKTQLQDYFLHRRNIDKWSAATMRICYSGIKFFFINVLQRNWHTLELIHAKREQRLPTVLSLDEVRAILAAVNTPQNKAYLTAVYSCGLRLHEALYILRSYWKQQRNPVWIFPRLGHSGNEGSTAKTPMDKCTVQGALRRVLKQLNIKKRVSVHTLRHSYATHLLEAPP